MKTKPIKLIEGKENQNIYERLEVLRLKINELIEELEEKLK